MSLFANILTFCLSRFWGANYWGSRVKPVAGGGIPSNLPIVELKLTFKDGGAFDYHTVYEQIRERLHQALSVARDHGHGIGSIGALSAAELAQVNLEQLPAYEPAEERDEQTGAEYLEPTNDIAVGGTDLSAPRTPKEGQDTPNEPPPGYVSFILLLWHRRPKGSSMPFIRVIL